VSVSRPRKEEAKRNHLSHRKNKYDMIYLVEVHEQAVHKPLVGGNLHTHVMMKSVRAH
jgi:hypothetical protein